MENKYYVYEYIRLDTNEPFYIGKGHGKRWRDRSHRGKHFKNIIKNVGVAVIILHDNLTEKEAFEYECWYIWQLRDIEGYNLLNFTDGGDGVAGYKWDEEYRQSRSGENHPFYGTSALNTKRVGIIKDGEIIKEFESVHLLWEYIKNNYPRPNGRKFIYNCLRENRIAHGFKFVYLNE